jgi:uncharacterized protein YdhG (YjbR/CyaY superfamily)
MDAGRSQPRDIDEYIAAFPPDVQAILQKIRATIHAAAPEAQESISYAMPTFSQNGYLVYFAAYKKHIGFYPAPIGVEQFKDEIAEYETGKGTLQFPLAKPIPYDLISKIVTYRVQENLAKAEARRKA